MTTNEHYNRGLKSGSAMTVCTIAINNVWGGRTKDGGHVSSYEKLGYHAGSLDFIRGVFDSGCAVIRYFVNAANKIECQTVDSYAELCEALGITQKCKHQHVVLVGNEETGLRSATCHDCGCSLSRRVVNGEYVYFTAKA